MGALSGGEARGRADPVRFQIEVLDNTVIMKSCMCFVQLQSRSENVSMCKGYYGCRMIS